MTFGKAVAEVYKDLKRDFQHKTQVSVPDNKGGSTQKPIDGSVREEINADLDRRIKDYEQK